MKWTEIIANTTEEGADLVADAFFSIGCMGGVKIMDKNDVLDVVHNTSLWDYIEEDLLEKDSTVRVSGFFSLEETQSKAEEFRAVVRERNLPVTEINFAEIDDSDWYDNWKRYYAPIVAGRFVIVPKWLKYDDEPTKTKVLIDPGMAFGTGSHESTKLCLMLMSEEDFREKQVIDVGTGSGILGAAALLSGAKNCYMCDIDSVAVKAAKENVLLNGVQDRADVENADLLTKSDKIGAIVMANLTADILERLAKDLPSHIETNGVLICSGIIHSRVDDVKRAFADAGMTLVGHISMGEWDGMKFKK